MAGIAIVSAISIFLYYFLFYYSAVRLRVLTYCVYNSTAATPCIDRAGGGSPIKLNDQRAAQSPKLKEALLKSPLAMPNGDDTPEFTIELTPSEFDSMNYVLVKADPDAAKNYNSDPETYKSNPTLGLWPRAPDANGGVWVAYHGNVYWMAASFYLPISHTWSG